MNERMKPEIKALWVAALRSGEYIQVQEQLRKTDDAEDVVGHCCLGVLTDLYCKANHVSWLDALRYEREDADGNLCIDTYGDEDLSPLVRAWAGVKYAALDVIFGERETNLIRLNDGDVSLALGSAKPPQPFSVIADLIEEQL